LFLPEVLFSGFSQRMPYFKGKSSLWRSNFLLDRGFESF
jgi:hypothetical protein